jgi:hypothetical protein
VPIDDKFDQAKALVQSDERQHGVSSAITEQLLRLVNSSPVLKEIIGPFTGPLRCDLGEQVAQASVSCGFPLRSSPKSRRVAFRLPYANRPLITSVTPIVPQPNQTIVITGRSFGKYISYRANRLTKLVMYH